MKIRLFKDSSQSGSILFITLILAVMLGTTMASYLYWVRTQNVFVAESQAWNSAIGVAEAGIEEGMAQINVNVGNVGSVNLLNYSGSIASATNGWSGTGPYSKSNSLGYSVIVSNDAPPTIYSTATTKVPLLGQAIKRTVMVTTATNSLFGVAIAALQDITMNGNNIYVDAFDSADTFHFPGGLYNTNYAMAKADVATAGGILSVGNADIHGRLILAPGASATVGSQGLVGDMPAQWPAQSGIETPTNQWVITDFNKEFPDVVAPYNSGSDPTTTGNSTNQYDLPGGNYYVSGNLQVANNKVLYVRSGVVNLYVTGTFDAKANSLIAIGSGASLKLYVGAATGSGVAANFGQVNNAGNAYNFQFYGLPTCTGFNLNGNGAYIGTVYAPEALLTFNGGGSTTLDFQGACVVKSATLNGHFNIHYDVNLSRVGPPGSYTVASWREL